MPQVAICLVTYNNADTIEATLASAEAQTGVEQAIYVWDNASRDGTRELIRKHKKVTLYESPVNCGFCGGYNRLLSRIVAPYILFLNPDAAPETACTSRLLETLQTAPGDVAGVGPKMVKPAEPDGTVRIDSAGIVLSKHNLSPHDRGQDEIDRGQYDQPGPYFGPSLACALLRREALEKLNIDGELLDEDFFAYYEDVDLAWRAQRLGLHFLYAPHAVCEHRRGHPETHGPALAARAFANRYLMLLANETGPYGYLWYLIPREAARFVWKGLHLRGFFIGLRMLRDGWSKAKTKRKRLSALAGGAQ